MSLLPNQELFNTNQETLPNPKTGKSKVVFTSFRDAQTTFGIDPNSVVGEPGAQSKTLECTLHPDKVAKIGKASDLFTEAVCLAILSKPDTEIVVSPASDGETLKHATELCIIVPRVPGVPYQDQFNYLTQATELPEHAITDLIQILKRTSINAIVQKILLSEQNGITLNDIQLRQIVSKLGDNRKADFVDYSAAYIDYYHDETLIQWLSFLDKIGSSDLEVNKYARETVLHHFQKLTIDPDLQRAIGGNIDPNQIDLELVQWQAELLLRKTANAVPRAHRSPIEVLASDIDYAKPPTPLNKLKDLIFGSNRTGERQKLPNHLIQSLELSKKYLEESNIITWMSEKPEEFANIMILSLQKAFLSFDNLSFNRAHDIDWQDLKDELKTLATTKPLTKPVGEDRRKIIDRIKKKLVKNCTASDVATAIGCTNDLRILSDIMEKSDIPGFDVLGYQLNLLCEIRLKLVQKLKTITKDNDLQQYFVDRDKIKASLEQITELIARRTNKDTIRPIPIETLDVILDLHL